MAEEIGGKLTGIRELRVIDLKKELEARSLSKTGSKKDLVERLESVSECLSIAGVAYTAQVYDIPLGPKLASLVMLMLVARARNFFPINAPGMGRFQLLNLGVLGYRLELRFWVVIAIIVSLTLTITLITTLTII